MPSQTNFNKVVPLGSILLVVHDFKVDIDETLSLEKGDFVQVIADGPKFGDGWFLDRGISSGEIGRIPYSCTMLISQDSHAVATQLCDELEAQLRLRRARQREPVSASPVQCDDASSDAPQCGICLDELVNAYALPCGDVFCEQCISRWLQDSRICPLDRQAVPADVKEDLDNSPAPPPPYTKSSNFEQLDQDPRPALVPSITLSGTHRPNISWPLERRHGVVRRMSAGVLMDRENESFWRQMLQLGRLSQESRQPIRQPAAVAVRG